MRKIKFRAWDKKKNEMIDDFALSFNKNLKIMQFTGLLDKNGKEIYEGDIVKILHGEWTSKSDKDERTLQEYLDSISKRYEIIFIDGSFLGRRNTGSYNPWSTDNEGNAYSRLIAEKHGYIEIIGNIFENKKLLENPKVGNY